MMNITISNEKLLEDFCKALHQELKRAIAGEEGITINLSETKIVKPATSYKQYRVAFFRGPDHALVRFFQGKLFYKRRSFIQKLFGNKDSYEYLLVQQVIVEHVKSSRGYCLGTKLWEEKILVTTPRDPFPYEQKLSRFTDQVPSVVGNILREVRPYRESFRSMQEYDKTEN